MRPVLDLCSMEEYTVCRAHSQKGTELVARVDHISTSDGTCISVFRFFPNTVNTMLCLWVQKPPLCATHWLFTPWPNVWRRRKSHWVATEVGCENPDIVRQLAVFSNLTPTVLLTQHIWCLGFAINIGKSTLKAPLYLARSRTSCNVSCSAEEAFVLWVRLVFRVISFFCLFDLLVWPRPVHNQPKFCWIFLFRVLFLYIIRFSLLIDW